MSDAVSPSGYRKSYIRYGHNPKSMQWNSYASAANRYRQLVNGLDLENKSILDAGCGMGDLLPYIYAHTERFEYLGVDLMPEFIGIAKERYCGHNFEVADPFSPEFTDRKFDIVFSCGVMNANVGRWMQKRQQMITSLFSLAKEALVFNMAGGHVPAKFGKHSRVAYARAHEVEAFCKTLSPKVQLNTGYNPNDFTITMYK